MLIHRFLRLLVVCVGTCVSAEFSLHAETGGVDLYGDPLPDGAMARLGTVRFRPHDGLHGAIYSADGKRLVGVAGDTIYYWNADDGRLIDRVTIERHGVQQVAFCSDRRWCCTSGFFFDEEMQTYSYTLNLWDLEGRRLLHSIELDREAQPSSLAISPDGTLVAAGTGRGRLHIYEVASGEELLSYAVTDREITTLGFSPDGRELAMAGRRMKLYLWDWEEGGEPEAVAGFEGDVETLAFSPDGKYLAFGADRSGGLQVWRTENWSKVELPAANTLQLARGVAFSPDSRLVATSDYIRETAMLWELSTGELLRSLPMRPEDSGRLAFSPDGKWLTAANEHYATPPRIWNIETGEPHEAVHGGHRIAPTAIEFRTSDETIVTAGDDGTARIWNARTGEQLRLLSHHPDHVPDRQYNVWIRAMAASDDGRLIATSSLDESVRLWDATTGEEIFRLAGHGRLGGHRAVEFTPGGDKLVSWGDDMYLRVWDTKTGKALAEHAIRPSGVEIPEGNEGPAPRMDFRDWRMQLSGATFSPDASRLLIVFRSAGYIFDVESGEELLKYTDEESNLVLSTAFSPVGQLFATSAWGRSVQTRLPDGRVRSSAARNHVVFVRRLADGEVVHRFLLPEGGAGPVAFSHDGKLLAMGVRQEGGPIRIHDVESGDPLLEITGFDGAPRALAFSRDGRLLASSLMDTTVLVWDLP